MHAAWSTKGPMNPTAMMSTAVHHFGPPFDNYQSSFGMLPQNAHFAPQPLHPPGPEAFSHAPQYAVQPIHHSSMNSDLSSRKRSISSRYGPYGNGTLGSTMGSSHQSLSEAHNVGPLGGSAPVRRRISRACDQCNQLRTRCDGQSPCAHCVGEYHELMRWGETLRARSGLIPLRRARPDV